MISKIIAFHPIDEFIECSASLTPKPKMRNLNQDNIAPAVIAYLEQAGSPRFHQFMTNLVQKLKPVLETDGSSRRVDLAEMLPKVFGEYSPNDPPARTAFQAAGLVMGARVEIEAIATVKD